MFGTKDVGFLEMLLRSRAAHAARRTPAKAVGEPRTTPIELLVRKETYFAMSRSSRWNQ